LRVEDGIEVEDGKDVEDGIEVEVGDSGVVKSSFNLLSGQHYQDDKATARTLEAGGKGTTIMT
jgi:hypothetical protein